MAAKAYSDFIPDKKTAEYATAGARKAQQGGGLFANIDPMTMAAASQAGAFFEDFATRANKGKLMETDAIMRAFGIDGSLADDFEKGVGGSSVVEPVMDAYLGGEAAKDRDLIRQSLRNFGRGAATSREDLLNTIDQRIAQYGTKVNQTGKKDGK